MALETFADLILGVATGLQVVAAAIAVTLVPVARIRTPFVLLALAFAIQAWRHYSTLVWEEATVTLVGALVALTVSLLVAGAMTALVITLKAEKDLG